MLVASAVAHAVLLVLLAWAPRTGPPRALPGVVMVDLVAPAAAPRAAAPRAAPSPPRPAAPPKVVLPKQPTPVAPKPKPEDKPKPTPEPRDKPKPEARPAPEPPVRRERPAEVEYEDVLKSLRNEAGETAGEPVEAARAGAGPVGQPGAAGAALSAEVVAWLRAARIHVRNSWVLAPGFRDEALETWVSVRLGPRGDLLGEPRVTRPSGNPWYDQSVVRAIQKASPLPPPPEAGEWSFVFRPEDRL